MDLFYDLFSFCINLKLILISFPGVILSFIKCIIDSVDSEYDQKEEIALLQCIERIQLRVLDQPFPEYNYYA